MERPLKHNLVGRQFDRLAVVALANVKPKPGTYWHCLCKCGTATIVNGQTLLRGTSRSCGCRQKDVVSEKARRHGQAWPTATAEYRCWLHLKERCNNPKHPQWDDYGGRGITVCESWQKSFAAFFADMGPRPGPEYSIDRINNGGNYEPGNCRWVTKLVQNNNRRPFRRKKVEV